MLRLLLGGLLLLMLAGCPTPSAGPDGGASDGGQDTGQDAGPDAGARCRQPSDCPTPDSCWVATCSGGACGTEAAAAGTTAVPQPASDCQHLVCDGAGHVVTHWVDAGVPCGSGGTLACDGQGTCAGCASAAQCPGQDSTCATRTCAAQVCGVAFTAKGTSLATQASGDCQKSICDGDGGTAQVADDTDLPAAPGECARGTCSGGAASHVDLDAGTPCGNGGSMRCDGQGACAGCLTAADCPGSDTACSARTCVGGVCGVAVMDGGTPLGSQTAGDCRQSVCDGDGGTAWVALDSDTPSAVDDCHLGSCQQGTPAQTPVSQGQTCSGGLCDAVGNCVACLQPSDCPGQDSECQVRTCAIGTCGVANTAAHTPTSAQTPGDCHVVECNGNGAAVPVIDNTDTSDDGNDCTMDVCNGGVPSHVPAVPGTTCHQNGGTKCDAYGVCSP